MSTVSRSLLWQQWREHRGIAGILIGVVFCHVAYSVACERGTGVPIAVTLWMSFGGLYMILAGTLLAMRTVAGEMTSGVAGFTAAWPVSASYRAAWRLGGALLTLAAPLLIGGLLLTALLGTGIISQPEPRSDVNPNEGDRRLAMDAMLKGTGPALPGLPFGRACGVLWTLVSFSLVDGTAFCAGLCLIAARFRRESWIALAGLIYAILHFAVLIVHETLSHYSLLAGRQVLGGLFTAATIRNWGYGGTDGRFFGDLEFLDAPWLTLLLRTLALVVFAGWYVRRAASILPSVEAAPIRVRRGWLPHWPVPRSRAGVLLWWHSHEGFLMALAGLALSVVMMLVGIWIEGEHRPDENLADARYFASASRIISLMFGTIWSLVVAVGLYADDLQPRLQHFWQARPLSMSTWFWTKFAIGLGLVLVVLDGLPLLLQYLVRDDFGYDYVSRKAWYATVPLLHVVAYSTGVACVCFWRSATWGGISGLLCGFVLMACVSAIPAISWLEPFSVFNGLSELEGWLADARSFAEDYRPRLTWRGYFYGVLPIWLLIAAAFAWTGRRWVERVSG